MKKIFFTVFLLAIISLVSAQKVLVLENLNIGKSYKLVVGKKISVITKNNPKKIKGRLTDIQDSTIEISNNYVFNLRDIEVIFKEQRAVYIVSTSLLRFGATFITLDAVNSLINNDRPVVHESVAIISAASAITGFILWFFDYRKCKVEKGKWRIKVIDQLHMKKR
jgi:hypothetical protein